MTVNTRDIGAGLIFIAIGILFGLGSIGLEIGTALRMGPGYFPLVLAGLLVGLGLVILAHGFGHPTTGGLAIPWRGLVPAVMLVVLISAFASQRMSMLLALVLSVALTLFCVLVFSFGLGLPLRLFGPWLVG